MDKEPILTDWRAEAARPFYEATPSNHGDIVMRRHKGSKTATKSKSGSAKTI